MEPAGPLIGSSGTLIGAALETAGYYYQSIILDALAGPFAHQVGGLIYLVGAIVAVVSVVVLGQYKLGRWLLVGPGVFFAVVFSRTETGGADWIFGGEQRESDRVQETALDALRDSQSVYIGGEQQPYAVGPARVSSLFASYNRIISSVTREIVRVISTGREDTDRDFVLRSELFAQMHEKKVEDVGLKQLVQHAFLWDCREMMETGREYLDYRNAREERDPAPNTAAARTSLLQKYRAASKKRVQLDTDVIEWLGQFRRFYGNEVYLGILLVEPFGDDIEARNQAFREWFELMDVRDDLGTPANPDLSMEHFRETVEETVWNCQRIWDFTFVGLRQDARRHYLHLEETAVANRVEAQKFWTDLDMMIQPRGQQGDGGAADRIRFEDEFFRYMALHTLKNEMNESSHAAFLATLQRRGAEFAQAKVGVESLGSEAMVEHVRVRTSEWQEKERMMTAAANLPYYQGLALFFLSVLFPFFALMLLVPGKHPAFLLWFVFWLWVKSWDIGFAMVMLLDDALWALFAYARPEGRHDLQVMNPDAAMAAYSLMELDPSYSLSTYYAIMGVALMSIPVISGQLVVGSLKGGAGLIASGIENTANSMSESSLFFEQQRMVGGLRIAAQERRLGTAGQRYDNVMSGRDMYENGPGQRPQMLFSARNGDGGVSIGQHWNNRMSQAPRIGNYEGVTMGGELTPDLPKSFKSLLGGGDGTRANIAAKKGGGKIADGALKFATTGAAVMRDYEKYKSEVSVTIANQDTTLLYKWAGHDTMASLDMTSLASTCRAAGMLPIPWVERGAWDEELGRSLKLFELRITKKRMYIKQARTVFDNIFKSGGAIDEIVGGVKDYRGPKGPQKQPQLPQGPQQINGQRLSAWDKVKDALGLNWKNVKEHKWGIAGVTVPGAVSLGSFIHGEATYHDGNVLPLSSNDAEALTMRQREMLRELGFDPETTLLDKQDQNGLVRRRLIELKAKYGHESDEYQRLDQIEKELDLSSHLRSPKYLTPPPGHPPFSM